VAHRRVTRQEYPCTTLLSAAVTAPLSIDDVAADQYANEYLSMQIVALDKN
jgi:hypothetical protein